MEDYLLNFRGKIIENLKEIFSNYTPEVRELYDPIFYSLEGGKKIRPVSVLMSADIFGGDINLAIIPALALEIFHNFTLLHDDVMDNSPVRRNRETVHKKWNSNQAILSGDAMLILVYQKLLLLPESILKKVLKVVNKTALEVCEGQQMDMDFENQLDITLEQYLKMIKLKTGVLIAASLALGAIISDATENDIDQIYNFGLNLGFAFQIQDDYFDTFGNYETFGKKIGNDIVTNKKTFLLINAFEQSKGEQLKYLKEIFSSETTDEELKIKKVKAIFENLGIDKITREKIDTYYNNALKNIDEIKNISSEKKEILFNFAEYILKRKK